MRSSFGKRLKELREEKHLSQYDLEIELDKKITHTAIWYWENNLRVPNLDMVILLADYFGVSLDYMAGLID